jgi:hypothetical protein
LDSWPAGRCPFRRKAAGAEGAPRRPDRGPPVVSSRRARRYRVGWRMGHDAQIGPGGAAATNSEAHGSRTRRGEAGSRSTSGRHTPFAYSATESSEWRSTAPGNWRSLSIRIDTCLVRGGGQVTPRWSRGKGRPVRGWKPPELAAAARTWEVVVAGEALPPRVAPRGVPLVSFYRGAALCLRRSGQPVTLAASRRSPAVGGSGPPGALHDHP